MKEIGDCAKEWADKALDGPPVADINWLLRTAFISGAAEQAYCAPTYPQDDPRPSDPAELARQVAMELRKHSLFAAVFFDDEPTTIYVQRPQRSRLNVVGSRFPDTYWAPLFVLSQEFDGMGPIAIADEIQAAEVRRAQEWAGDPPC